MDRVFLYTLEGCDPCEGAKETLKAMALAYREVPIDNPLVALGVQTLFSDHQIHAPLVVIPNVGIYILSPKDNKTFRRFVDLRNSSDANHEPELILEAQGK